MVRGVLRGRAADRGLLLRALDEARDGRPRALVVTGEAGVGKTALVGSVVDDLTDATVLRTRGREAEAPIPYAGLHALLSPLLGELDVLPEPQARALGGALALRASDGATDRFGVGVGTAALLGGAAEDRLVVVVVDDGQWLDGASWEALVFAAHRLRTERVAVLVTWRDDVPREAGAGFERVALTGLPADVVPDLLAPRAVTTSVATALHAATGGNPLALLELARVLDDEHLDGRRPLPDPLPAGRDVVAAFGRRVTALPEPCQEALLVLAAGGPLDAAELRAATRGLGLADDALDPAEADGLVVHQQGQLELVHPLVRSAVYWGSTPARRRDAHRALAAAVDDPRRATWHTAEATLGPDDAVATALVAAAEDARRRGALGAAARALERSAELTTDRTVAALRLVEAAQDALHAGAPAHARTLLDRAGAPGTDAAAATAARVRAAVHLWSGRSDDARVTLEETARTLAATDPATAAVLTAEAVIPSLASGDVAAAARIARAAAELAPPGTAHAPLVTVLTLTARVCSGEPTSALLASVGRHPEDLADRDPNLAGAAALPLVWVEQHDRARLLLRRVLGRARASNAPTLAPLVLTSLAELELRAGNMIAAHAHVTEAIELAEHVGRPTELMLAHVAAARWAAIRGDAEAVDAHVGRAAPIVAASGNGSVETTLLATRGLLALGLSRTDEAVAHLREAARVALAHGLAHPGVVQWRGDAVEALVQAGEHVEARHHLEVLEREAAATENRAAARAAARGRLLLAHDDDVDAALEAARRAHEGPADQPLERARTALVIGERLRRERRRREARLALTEAADVFRRLGATAWQERAERELRACGARPATAAPPGLRDLTAQELQIALAVAEGGTNKDVAAALFLSPRTVESHLGRVFRKLGLRSRTELTAIVLRDTDDARAGG